MKHKTRILLAFVCLFSVLFAYTLPVQAFPKKITHKRFSGNNRFETSLAIANELNANQQFQNIILASSSSYSDALAASTLAFKLKAPILLVGAGLEDSTLSLNYIKKHLNPGGRVLLIGGIGVISQGIEKWMLNNGLHVARYGGRDRFDTNDLLVQQLNVPHGTPVILANAYDFPDALGISSLAASKGWPILLTNPANLPLTARNFLTSDQPTKVYIIGGEGVIHDSIESQIQTLVPDTQIERFGGSDRFETVSSILTQFYPRPDQIYLASGLDYADALSGSALAAENNAPILLVDPRSKTLPESIYNYLITIRNTGVQPDVNVLGGEGAVPQRLLDIVSDLLESNIVVNPDWANETLSVTYPSETGFTLGLSPALNGLTTSDIQLRNRWGQTVALDSLSTSNRGATYTVRATLTSGETYTVTAKETGYTFNTASFTLPSDVIDETLTVSNASTTGFTLKVYPALDNLTANQLSLKNHWGYPVALSGLTTSNHGQTYTVSAALTAGETYTVTAILTGHTFSTAPFTVPATGVTETLTISGPSTAGFTIKLTPALDGLTLSDFSLFDHENNVITPTHLETSNGGATYTLTAALTSGETYTLTASKTGYTFSTARVTLP